MNICCAGSTMKNIGLHPREGKGAEGANIHQVELIMFAQLSAAG